MSASDRTPAALFRRAKLRFQTAGAPERAAWMAGLVATSPVTVPVFLGFWSARRIGRRYGRGRVGAWRARFATLTRPEPAEIDEAAEAAIAAEPDSFALVRIIGNDLPPRHKIGQSRENVAFVLEHEPDLPGCEKMWLVNRIADPAEEARLVALLEAAGQSYKVLPFDLAAYARMPLDLSLMPGAQFLHSAGFEALTEAERARALTQTHRLKNVYAMHNNGARNAALDWGRERAKWVLPWDGNCFLTAEDWARLRADIAAQPDRRYHIVPMARLGSNDDALRPVDPAEAREEPQILFRRDATLRFDERHPYGRRPKVELFARLGVPGPWFDWVLDPWDLPAGPVGAESHRVGRAGVVRRLSSGRTDLETNRDALQGRGVARSAAILSTLRAADRRMLEARGFDPARPLFFGAAARGRLAEAPEHPLARALRDDAAAARGRGPYAVTEKTEMPPGGDPHDYYHPAPYWWPNPRAADGLPFIKRDGERRPGTVMYEPESDRYDRTRLQMMGDDAIASALAFAAFGDEGARDHARRLVETWFLDEATAMHPHLRFAQVRRGHANDEGSATGIIEFKDIAYLLDAVRLLGDADLSARLKGWLRPYAEWLKTSGQGRKERQARNNHGVFYDLQLASIAAFLGDLDTLLDCYLTSMARVTGHFEPDGAQPHELARTLSQHYCAFNLTGWLSLACLYRAAGFALEQQPEMARIGAGIDWLLTRRDAVWQHQQIEPFDPERLAPVALLGEALELGPPAEPRDREVALSRPRFHPHDGVPPYWPLILDPAQAWE